MDRSAAEVEPRAEGGSPTYGEDPWAQTPEGEGSSWCWDKIDRNDRLAEVMVYK